MVFQQTMRRGLLQLQVSTFIMPKWVWKDGKDGYDAFLRPFMHKWQDMGFKLNEIMHDLEEFEMQFSRSIFLGRAVLETGFRVHDQENLHDMSRS